jgi:hypothetical protein
MSEIYQARERIALFTLIPHPLLPQGEGVQESLALRERDYRVRVCSKPQFVTACSIYREW